MARVLIGSVKGPKGDPGEPGPAGEADYTKVAQYEASAKSHSESAAASATAASSSASAASTSATNAKTSETNAASSKTAAASSASAAASSASAAKTSETNAASSASTATSKATAASNSAINAANSATAAAASAALAQKIADNMGTAKVEIPDYWKSAADAAVSKVKALQVSGGQNAVSFCWFSDLHYVPTSAYTKNVGNLCAYMMKECDIPFTLFTGDTTTASGLPSEEITLEYIDDSQEMLSVIGHDKLMTCRGNHDDVWGTYTPSGGSTVHFVNKIGSHKMWYHMHRLQAMDTRRHYGPHGTYFYLDDNPHRVRYIVLNCQFYEGGDITSTTGQMTGSYGTKQLEWLRDEALDVPSGYGAIIATHNPPTAKNINGNTYYLSQIADAQQMRDIVQESSAEVLAIFAGHCHADAMVTNDLSCPIVTITSAVNTPYDADKTTRVEGTATETVIDIVTIDRGSKTINCTRLGYGSDRSCSYAKSYTITQNLTYVTSSNTAASVAEGSAFTATLTAVDGYELSTVTVMMGGVSITSSAYSGGKVNIASVTGDVVITAVAESSTSTLPITWKNGYNASYTVGQTCTVSANASYITCEPIPVEYGKTYSMTVTGNASDFQFRWIGINGSGVVTEMVNNNTIGYNTQTVSWTPTKQETTQLRIRGYAAGAPALMAVTELIIS